MKRDIDAQFLCRDCERYGLCEYYHNQKDNSYICKYFHLSNKLDKIRAEIEQMPSELTADGRRMIRRESVFRILDKYRVIKEGDTQ